MLQELLDLVKGSAHEPVINSTDIPNEHNDDVVAEATNTVASGLRNMVAGGGLQNIISLFTHKDAQGNGTAVEQNPMVNMMTGHFADKLMNKFNLSSAKANNVASGLIPDVIKNLIHKTNDPNNSSFSLEGLLHSLTGGKSTELIKDQQSSGNTGFNFQDLVGHFTGNNSQGNGGSGLMDIVSKLATGAQEQQQKNGGGGLMDLIKGFLK